MDKFKSISRSNSSTPNKSSPRGLPESHIIQNRYQSYHRAEDFIKHLNKKYNSNIISSGIYDDAYYKSFKFKRQEPQEISLFKVSQFPKAKVNQELLEQQEILNAFNTIISESRPQSKSRPRSTIPVHKRSRTEKTSFSYQKTKLSFSEKREKCEKCQKKDCTCPKKIKDKFLKTILKKHLRALQKASSISVYGKARKNKYTAENKEKCVLKNTTFDEPNCKSTDSKHKVAKKFLKSPGKKDPEVSRSTLDQSIKILPLSLSQRKSKKQSKIF